MRKFLGACEVVWRWQKLENVRTMIRVLKLAPRENVAREGLPHDKSNGEIGRGKGCCAAGLGPGFKNVWATPSNSRLSRLICISEQNLDKILLARGHLYQGLKLN